MSQELAIQAAKQPVRRYSLDPVRPAFEEFLMRSARLRSDERWCDKFKSMAKALAPDIDEYTIDGNAVAKIVPGQLNVSKLAEELPDIHAKYTRAVTKIEFDQEAFRRDEPELFKHYQARRFCVTGE